MIFDYDIDPQNPTTTAVSNISPYLVEGADDAVIRKQQNPLCDVAEMRCGNKPSDGGNLVLSPEEREDLLQREPKSAELIRPYLGSRELINGIDRYCLWLAGTTPATLRACPLVTKRIAKVKEFRKKSTAKPTRNSADTPSQFFFISQPDSRFIAIPEVSSSNRRYIPIAFLEPETIVSNKIYVVAVSSMYSYGVLQSSMHMAWMRQVGGRLKSDYQYSGTIVYNTFVWPDKVTDKKRAAVEKEAESVLEVRKTFDDSTLADLYDPLTMPLKLTQAHARLDRAVDRCYRSQPFPSERNRFEFLFALYEQKAAPLVNAARKKRTR